MSFSYLKSITLEPSLLVHLAIGNSLSDLNTNLFLQKSCRVDRTHEPDLNTDCDSETEGILFVSEAHLRFTGIILLLNMLLTMFAMPWSDKAGRRRRPFIFIPLAGVVLQSLSGCLHSYFWQWPPIAAVVCDTVIKAVTGGPILMVHASYVYICDISCEQNRTTRLGFVGAIRLISLILGKGASGFVLRKVGFFHSYLVCFAISTVGSIFASILVKDISVKVEKEISFYRMFTNIVHDQIDNFRIVFRKSLGSRRIVILLLLICNSAILFAYCGEMTVLYQYLRYRFKWSEETLSGYNFYKFSTSALGILFCSVVLSKRLKWHDGLIGMLAAAFDTIAILGMFVATEAWQIYIIPLIDVLHGMALIISLSFVSKYYDANELGRLSAVISVFTLPYALSPTAYNVIYKHTLDTFPSAYCLLSIVLDLMIFICFCVAYALSKKLDRSQQYSGKSTMVNPDYAENDGDEVTARTPMKVLR